MNLDKQQENQWIIIYCKLVLIMDFNIQKEKGREKKACLTENDIDGW